MSRGCNKPYDSLFMNVEDALDDKQEKISGNEYPLKHTVLKSPFNLCWSPCDAP